MRREEELEGFFDFKGVLEREGRSLVSSTDVFFRNYRFLKLAGALLRELSCLLESLSFSFKLAPKLYRPQAFDSNFLKATLRVYQSNFYLYLPEELIGVFREEPFLLKKPSAADATLLVYLLSRVLASDFFREKQRVYLISVAEEQPKEVDFCIRINQLDLPIRLSESLRTKALNYSRHFLPEKTKRFLLANIFNFWGAAWVFPSCEISSLAKLKKGQKFLLAQETLKLTPLSQSGLELSHFEALIEKASLGCLELSLVK